ncbi:4Fe-4S dicluster domain-containing protein [Cuneatibacter caecimuris]|uniref:Na+-translocating ferredoxin:NAD+ oxidoreductase RnfC subunit n=1 Tax=Cuneatibacter caecimuris TaxID=1796618 RepID=A0A4Q7PNJ1_9FIRM|nr:4Fe-4S dicluster domain-containing protein [Cuneatibacter caecimuris]RZT02035.1 Na+-translocating ferredoxin:NAD+ oxidoreductase RnfC subunit [Cuneatibacter caecimuris]
MEMKELSAILQQHGICGAGGAGFPTYAKLDSRVKTIIMNCAECEPLLKLHRQLLREKTAEILHAFHVLEEAVGAEESIVAVKRSYAKTVAAVESEIGAYPDMRLKLLREVYPAGDEVVLIYESTGKVVQPGGLPIDIGVAVFNVETVYNLAQALKQDVPVTDKLVSVVAEVNHPVTVRVPLGVTVGDVVQLAGGATCKDPAYIMGGPMMGNLVSENDLITKTSNAIIVLPSDHYVIQRKKGNTKIELMRAAASCCQCQMCTDLCPRYLLGHPSHPHLFMRAATCKDVQDPGIFLDTLYCSSCGLCSMYSCPQGLAPAALLTEYKSGLRAAGIRPEKREAGAVTEHRQLRRVPVERLMKRMCLTHYNVPAPLKNEPVHADHVKLLMRQHIGAPACPVVKAGDMVEAGQMVAEPGKGLSLPVHASISGSVTDVTDSYIIINANQKGRAQ